MAWYGILGMEKNWVWILGMEFGYGISWRAVCFEGMESFKDFVWIFLVLFLE